MPHNSMGFIKCIVLCIHCYTAIQNSFTVLCFTESVLFPPQTGEFNLVFIFTMFFFYQNVMSAIITVCSLLKLDPFI